MPVWEEETSVVPTFCKPVQVLVPLTEEGILTDFYTAWLHIVSRSWVGLAHGNFPTPSRAMLGITDLRSVGTGADRSSIISKEQHSFSPRACERPTPVFSLHC